MNDCISKLKALADEVGYNLEIRPEADGSFVDTTLERDGISIDIVIPKHTSGSWAYDIESYGLPREIYPSNLSGGYSARERSEEILKTVENIVKKRIKFHLKANLFNKNAGFIELPIDGVSRKIKQTENYFKLPLA